MSLHVREKLFVSRAPVRYVEVIEKIETGNRRGERTWCKCTV